MSTERATLTPPSDVLQHEEVRELHGAYEDALQGALRLIERLRTSGYQEHADAFAADVMIQARRARIHLRQIANRARREGTAANTNARENAA